MATIYCSNDEYANQIVKAAFPSESGRKIQIAPFSGPMTLESYWSDGSRDYFVVINLATMAHGQIPQNGTAFDPQTFKVSFLPEGYAIVKHTIFCGKDLGFTIILNPENLNKLALPPAVELTRDEKIVLLVTKSYKSFCRLEYSKMTKEKFEETKLSLIAKKMLAKNGSITDAGRNAIEGLHRYEFGLF